MKILTASDIKYFRKGRTILDIPSFEIEQGKVMGVMGPNGAGKSTLLKVLALLLQPDSGIIFYKGTKVTKYKGLEVRRKMSVVFQEPLLLDGTVYWNMEIGLKLRGIKEMERRKRIEHWLENLNIVQLKNQHISTLSGGESQRVNLARALALEPEIIFLDEPFAYLDQPTKEKLIVDLYRILKTNSITTFFVTHDFREMLYLSDSACAIFDGKIVQESSPLDILNKPKNIQVATFIGIENIFRGRISLNEADRYYIELCNGGTIIACGNFEYKVGEEVNVVIRSENVSIVTVDCALPNTYPGRITDIYPTGYGWKCKVFVFGERITVNLIKDNKGINIGEEVFVNISPEDVFLIHQDVL